MLAGPASPTSSAALSLVTFTLLFLVAFSYSPTEQDAEKHLLPCHPERSEGSAFAGFF
jgi:hypothetical protein